MKISSHQNTSGTVRLAQRASVASLVCLVQNREIHAGEAEKRKTRGKEAAVRRGFPAYLWRSMTAGSLSLVFAVDAVIGCGWEF